MHKIFLLMILLWTTSMMANDIHWAKDFDSGIAQAIKENKPVMFVFSRHTCKFCVILEKTTFSDERVINKINQNFIPIVSYTDENDYTPRGLWSPGTPATWFLKSNGEPMYEPLVGVIDTENFLRGLDIVKAEFEKIEGNGKQI